jgi:cysteine desulfurase
MADGIEWQDGPVERPVYMDYNATTPVDPRVIAAMTPFWADLFANAASEHSAGRRVRRAVEDAREQVAVAIGVAPSAVVFTSGSTESVNLALQGVANRSNARPKIVTFATEHKAVLDTCDWLAGRGAIIEVLPVNADGIPDLQVAADRIDAQTTLVSVMAVNNETGVVNPVREISDMARRVGALVHCDATQALGKIAFNIDELGVDMASVSSHKVYGPKGVGALLVGREQRHTLEPLIHGGGHERGLRSGTLNSPGIVGFGQACVIAIEQLLEEGARIARLRDRLEAGIAAVVSDAQVIGAGADRAPNTLNVRLPGRDAEALLLAMPSIAASTGSACTASSPSPSHVLRAMGLGYVAAQECIRLSLGRFTTTEDVDAVVASVARALNRALVSEVRP